MASASLAAVFGTGPPLTLAQECARAVLIFLWGLVLVRLGGRRLFAKWAAIDIIVAVMLGSNLSRALTGGAPLWPTLAASTLLVLLHWLFAQGAARSRRLSRLLEGRSRTLVSDGACDEAARRRAGVSAVDLAEALHQQGLDDVGQARRVHLEPSGQLTVLKR